jgi:hypothetical protein
VKLERRRVDNGLRLEKRTEARKMNSVREETANSMGDEWIA